MVAEAERRVEAITVRPPRSATHPPPDGRKPRGGPHREPPPRRRMPGPQIGLSAVSPGCRPDARLRRRSPSIPGSTGRPGHVSIPEEACAGAWPASQPSARRGGQSAPPPRLSASPLPGLSESVRKAMLRRRCCRRALGAHCLGRAVPSAGLARLFVESPRRLTVPAGGQARAACPRASLVPRGSGMRAAQNHARTRSRTRGCRRQGTRPAGSRDPRPAVLRGRPDSDAPVRLAECHRSLAAGAAMELLPHGPRGR